MSVITAAQAPNPSTEGENENETSPQERQELRRARGPKLAVILKRAWRPDWVREYVEH